MLIEELTELGLTSKQGNTITKTVMADILHNPFYYGMARFSGRLYKHNAEPLVSYDLWKEVQDLLSSQNNNPHNIKGKDFLFRHLVKCGVCGCNISFVEKKGRYIYGFCSVCYKYRRQYHYINQEKISDMVKKVLLSIRFSDSGYACVTSELQSVYNSVKKRMGGVPDEDGTTEKRLKEELLLQQNTDKKNSYEKVCLILQMLVKFRQFAIARYESGTMVEKQEIVRFAFAEIVQHAKNINFTLIAVLKYDGKVEDEKKWLLATDLNRRPSG